MILCLLATILAVDTAVFCNKQRNGLEEKAAKWWYDEEPFKGKPSKFRCIGMIVDAGKGQDETKTSHLKQLAHETTMQYVTLVSLFFTWDFLSLENKDCMVLSF